MTENFKSKLDADVKLINDTIQNFCSCGYLKASGSPQDKVIEAENYSVSAGGKRIRPLLCIEFCRLFGGDITESTLNVAVCLELMHTFSLVHDDMPEMDNDRLRRGKPSTHAKFGQDIALLAGDGLCILPFEIISREACEGKIPYKTAAELVNILSVSAGNRGMIMGQTLDLLSENKDIKVVNKDFLIKMSSLKTGCMLKASCLFGAALADADEKRRSSAVEYAANLGLAFQMVDDILDVKGDEKLLGKPIGSDKARNKITFADALGADGALSLAKEYTEAAVAAVKEYDGSDFLCELAQSLVSRKF